MMQSRILKEQAGEGDFYRLLDAFSGLPTCVALWSHAPPSDQSACGGHYPLHYFENEGWLAVSRKKNSPTEDPCSLSSLRDCLNNPHRHLFGYFSYDLKNELEALTSTGTDPFEFPPLWFFEPELLLRFRGGRIECLHAETELLPICRQALQATDVAGCALAGTPSGTTDPDSAAIGMENDKIAVHRGPHSEDPAKSGLPFEPMLTFAEYRNSIEAIRRHITGGDVYELNYCMEWQSRDAHISPVATWKAMNERTRAPFSVYLRMNHHYVLCASPERFLRKQGTQLISQPIKGTAPRHRDVGVDRQNARGLESSRKEMAENLMIVDLVRNDLSRSCAAGTVLVPELCKVFALQTVHQMCSTVTGKLLPQTHPLDALLNAFPMGSMTGAPKISAMQLIDRLEPFKRGIFSGSIGYFTPYGDFDFNVVIRSLLYRSDIKLAVVRAGSAITYDSTAEQEWVECHLKAQAILDAPTDAKPGKKFLRRE